MNFIKQNDTIVTGKILVRVTSWENDGDNYRTQEVLFDSMERVKELVSVLEKHKGYGNGEFNPSCSAIDRDTIGDYVGYEVYSGMVRVLESIELVTYTIQDNDVLKTIRVVDLNG